MRYKITLHNPAFGNPSLQDVSDAISISPYEAHILGQSAESGSAIEFPNTYSDFVATIYKLKNQQIRSSGNASSQRIIADIYKIAGHILDKMETYFENTDLPSTPVDDLHEDLRLLQLLSIGPQDPEQIELLALHSFAIENNIFWSKHLLVSAKNQLTISKLAQAPDRLQVWMLPCFLLDVCAEQNHDAVIDELFKNHVGHFALFCIKRLDTQFENSLYNFLLAHISQISDRKICFAVIYFLYYSKIRLEDKFTLCRQISEKVVEYDLLSIYESAFRHIVDGFSSSRSLRHAAVQLADCTEENTNFVHGFTCGNRYYLLLKREHADATFDIEKSVNGLLEFVQSKQSVYDSIEDGNNCSCFDYFMRALVDQYIAEKGKNVLFASYNSLLPLFNHRDNNIKKFIRRNYTNAAGNYYSRYGKRTEYKNEYISLVKYLVSKENRLFAFFLILNSQSDESSKFAPDVELKSILSSLLKDPSMPEKYKEDSRIKLWFPPDS